jgi:predicted enzyme related to lactoylglutathione lyase
MARHSPLLVLLVGGTQCNRLGSKDLAKLTDTYHLSNPCEAPVPDYPTSNPAQFIQGCPVLHVRDVVTLAGYFRDVLGFCWDFGDERYAVVWRDNSAVHFMKAADDPTGVHLFQWIRDVDSYHAEVAARGADITVKPCNTPYGTREFTLKTPSGLAVVFGQDID